LQSRATSTRDAALACAAYIGLTLAMTWPLARGLRHHIAADLGDPVFNAWILARNAQVLLQAIHGHLSALATYWHPGIFYPHPYTLAYSEHLTPQVLQILPVYAITGNPILCYNLIFLSTFVLSGLGMFLFVRELTGRGDAAFVAGLAFAFAPYRFGALSHVQVLSSAWMPFVLYGLRRFFDTDRVRPLAWAAVAWIAQNLSCGYYLLFFSPFAVAYCAWELTVRRRWRDRRTLARLAVAVAAVGTATLPFLLPYLDLRKLGFDPRPLEEVDKYSADTWTYLTADVTLRLWGRFARVWPQAEGQLFPGVTIVLLAAAAAGAAWSRVREPWRPASTVRILAWATAVAAAVVVAMAFGWRVHTSWLQITDIERTAIIAVVLGVVLLAIAAPLRRTLAAWMRTPAGCFVVFTVAAVLLSLGPHVHAGGRLVDDRDFYLLLYQYVPGFDGVRVPARFAMIVALDLAVLAGLGVAALARGPRARALVVAAGALVVVESIAVPIPIDLNFAGYRQSGLAPLPDSLQIGPDTPPVYGDVAGLPADAVILELPFGEPAFEIRYMLHALDHHHRLVNGYSGGEPLSYTLLREELKDALTEPERAWRALAASGATDIVVHEAGYEGDRGPRISAWLRAHGAREVFSAGTDRVFALPASVLTK
jgi:hypothetical protein